MIELIVFLIVGFLAGLLAKALMPGSSNEPGGFWMTALLGIVGAFVGGFLGRAFGFAAPAGSFSFAGIIWAALGAIVVIAIMRLVTGSRRIA